MKLNTNKEKLNDAVGMLDEDTVQTAMIRAADLKETRVARRATLRRRAVVKHIGYELNKLFVISVCS